MLLGLPMAGILLAGRPVAPYLEFPPLTRLHVPAPFSIAMFVLFAVVDLIVAGLLVYFLMRASARLRELSRQRIATPFPLWGWLGLGLLLFGWFAAWTRMPWLAWIQEHTYVLPWSGYILLVNAWCAKRSGRSLLTDSPRRFLALILASVFFWWFFEYLNRFVQNWHYVGGADYSAGTYALMASLAFATVLPAVLSTQRLLLTFTLFDPGLEKLLPLRVRHGRAIAWAALIGAAGCLSFLGIYPDRLFSTVWFAPLLILTALGHLSGERTIFSPLAHGDWRAILASAIAATICGFFWEMWNVCSLARWEYAVPFVDRFHIFAMPLLGYGGYPPFGLECLAVGRQIHPDV
jgi:hypothetical protein